MTHRLPLLFLALLLLAPVAWAKDAPEVAAPPADAAPPMAAKVRPDNLLVDTLPNGLQVVIEERHATPIVHVMAYMKIGSLYEGEYLGSGLSHYMEHIVSGGSTRRQVPGEDGQPTWVGRTEEENKVLLKSIGGVTNAATFYNFTQYYITTQSDMADTAVDLIGDYLQHCQFDPVEVEREQRVVQQELLRNEDNPNRFRNRLFSETMFKVHPVRIPIIGYVDTINRITRDDMVRFYDMHYTPQNCVVSIVGDVDKDAVLELVKERFGGWKRKSLAPYMIPEEPQQSGPRWVEKEHGSTKTCLVTMGVPSIPLQHPDLYALDMMSNVLGIAASARLPAKFEHDAGRTAIANGIFSSNWTPVFGAGRFAMGFSTDTLPHARQLVEEVWAEVSRLADELVTEEEMARALKVLEKYHYQGRAKLDARAESLASNLAWMSDPLYTDTYLENIRKVTPEQIRDVARKYLRRDLLNVAIVTPPQAAPEQAAEQTKVAEGEVHKVVLDNGLTVLLKRIPDYGMVDVAAAFHGGVIYEDEQTNGLFLLMANTFWRGTESMDFQALNGRMDDLGMELEASSHNNVYYVKMKALADDFEPSLALFADVLLRPAVPPAWVENMKGYLLTRVLPNVEVQAEEKLEKVLRNTLYTNSPYRRQALGTKETVASFTPEQVRALYETFTRPNNAVLAIYGDIDVDATERQVRSLFGDWEPGEIPPSGAVEDPGLLEDRVVELTNRQVRTNYRIGWRAFPRQDEKNLIAMSVMNAIMGSQGWLHARLREGDNDYVYAVYSRPYQGDRAGHFFVNTDFSPQDEEKVVGIIDGVVADMKAGKFTDEELELAKTMILCYDALGKQENDGVVSGDALSELYGQGYDHDKAYYEGIRTITREDVVAAANRIFDGPALRIFIRPAAGE